MSTSKAGAKDRNGYFIGLFSTDIAFIICDSQNADRDSRKTSFSHKAGKLLHAARSYPVRLQPLLRARYERWRIATALNAGMRAHYRATPEHMFSVDRLVQLGL